MPLALALVALLGLVAWSLTRSSSPDAPLAAADAAPEPDLVARALDQGEQLAAAVGRTVTSLWSPPAAAAPYAESIAQAENRNNLPQGLLARLLYQESRFRPEIISGEVASPAGALGIAQFMPATAAERGVDPLEPHAAIDAAAEYLRELYEQVGSWAGALAAYNWGVGNVKRKGLAAAPAETQRYVSEISKDVGLTS